MGSPYWLRWKVKLDVSNWIKSPAYVFFVLLHMVFFSKIVKSYVIGGGIFVSLYFPFVNVHVQIASKEKITRERISKDDIVGFSHPEYQVGTLVSCSGYSILCGLLSTIIVLNIMRCNRAWPGLIRRRLQLSLQKTHVTMTVIESFIIAPPLKILYCVEQDARHWISYLMAVIKRQ